MSGDIRNIIKKQVHCDKRILDMIKNYLWKSNWGTNPHLTHIYWSIVKGRKKKKKNFLRKLFL